MDDSVLQKLDPQLHLHDCPQRSGHLYSPVPGRKDSHCACYSADHYHSGAVRRDLRALPDADAQLLVETAIESGLRWGDLTELRVADLDLASRMLTVSRKVIELNRKFHPDGKRFLVKRYPKDKGVPAAEAQPTDRCQAQGAHQGAQARAGRPPVCPPGSCTGPPPHDHRIRHARIYRSERGWAPVPARHTQRLQRRAMQVPALSAGIRGLPCGAPRGSWRLA